MISRLTTYAALFAVLTTATLAIATAAPQAPSATPVVQLETVVVTGHRAGANDQR
jgi:hypothetical protein